MHIAYCILLFAHLSVTKTWWIDNPDDKAMHFGNLCFWHRNVWHAMVWHGISSRKCIFTIFLWFQHDCIHGCTFCMDAAAVTNGIGYYATLFRGTDSTRYAHKILFHTPHCFCHVRVCYVCSLSLSLYLLFLRRFFCFVLYANAMTFVHKLCSVQFSFFTSFLLNASILFSFICSIFSSISETQMPLLEL